MMPDEDYRVKIAWDALPLVRFVKGILSGLRKRRQRLGGRG